MKKFEIYFRDLVPEAQKAVLAVYGYQDPEDGNWGSFPICTLEVMEADELE